MHRTRLQPRAGKFMLLRALLLVAAAGVPTAIALGGPSDDGPSDVGADAEWLSRGGQQAIAEGKRRDDQRRRELPTQSPPYTVYYAGPSIEGLPVTEVSHTASPPDPNNPDRGRQDDVTYVYGNCPSPAAGDASDVEGGCLPPIEVQSTPLCEAHASLYTKPGDTPDSAVPSAHDGMTIQGVPAASFENGTILEIYTGNTTISVTGGDPAQVRRVAENLRLAPHDDIPVAGQTLTSVADAAGVPPVLGTLPPPDRTTLSSAQECSS